MLNAIKFRINIHLLILYTLLVMHYFIVVHPNYEYYGFILNYSWSSIFIGCISLVMATLLIALIKNPFLFSIGILILITFTIPYILIYQFVAANNQILFAQLLLIVLFILVGDINVKVKAGLYLPSLKFSYLLAIVVVMLIPFIVIYGDSINIRTLWFEDIYSTRGIYKSKSNLYTAYSFSWLVRIMLPILLIFGLKTSNRLFIIVSTFGLLFLYVVSGHKSVFVGSFLVLIFYYGSYKLKIVNFLRLINFILIIGLIGYFLFDNLFISSIAVRRAFLVPALLNEYYFEFFKTTHLYWSNSVLSFLTDYPFDVSPAHLIGEKYFNSSTMAANNGLISDGFMNAGFFGVLINIALFTLLFKVISRLNIDSSYYGVFFFLILGLMSSSLTIVLFTHGGIVLLVILALFKLKE